MDADISLDFIFSRPGVLYFVFLIERLNRLILIAVHVVYIIKLIIIRCEVFAVVENGTLNLTED